MENKNFIEFKKGTKKDINKNKVFIKTFKIV